MSIFAVLLALTSSGTVMTGLKEPQVTLLPRSTNTSDLHWIDDSTYAVDTASIYEIYDLRGKPSRKFTLKGSPSKRLERFRISPDQKVLSALNTDGLTDIVFDRKGNVFTYRATIPKSYRFWSWGPNNTIIVDDFAYEGPPHPYLDTERSDIFLFDWKGGKALERLGEVERIGFEGTFTASGTVYDSIESYEPQDLNEYSLMPFKLLRKIPLPVVSTEGSAVPPYEGRGRFAFSYHGKIAYSNVIRSTKTDKAQGPLKLKTEFLLEVRLRDIKTGKDLRVVTLPIRPSANQTEMNWMPSRRSLFVSVGEDKYVVKLTG